MGNCARTVRKKERRCTMPSAWKSKTEILVEVLSKKANTIRMRHKKPRGAVLSRRFAILIAIFFATIFFASAQSIPSGRTTEPSQSAPSDQPDESKDASSPSLLTALKPQTLEAFYHPITPRQSLRWFITTTIGPPHLAGGIFASAFGTALDRPKEYGPHWGGFADRYGMRMTGIITGNAIEASAGLMLREDPRYFRVPDRPFKARVGNVVRLTFAARGDDGSFGPAYARYMAICGNNFLSDTWRVHSEANAQNALLRTAEGFAGRMVANAFEEFWPDVKMRVFHKRR
jgi:hypothetical protein